MARPIGGTPSNSEASNIPKKVALISGATFLLLVLLLRFCSLVPYIYAPCKRPTKNQGWTKERPKNSQAQKSTFVKIAAYSGAIERTNGIAAKGVARNKKVDE